MRQRWLASQDKFPAATVSDLRRFDAKVYFYLYRHDRGWLLENSPARRESGGHRVIDWAARDRAIAKTVTESARILRSWPKPVQLTKTALLREAGFLWVWPNKIRLLPETALTLEKNAEDRIEFAKRRIEAAARRLFARQMPVVEWRLQREAGLRPELLLYEDVRSALRRTVMNAKSQLRRVVSTDAA